MLGLGLSLLGGAVMETPAGATSYFPAASVYHAPGSTAVTVQTPRLYNVSAAAWSPAAARARLRMNIASRGVRHATNTFGCLAQDVSTLWFVFVSSTLNIGNGNRTTFEYTPASLPYNGPDIAANYEVLSSSGGFGDYELKIADNRWALKQFGASFSGVFAAVRLPHDTQTAMRHYLFGMTTVGGTFYGSYIVNTVLGVAYQCHPMRSAEGKAALYETTSKQLVTDATLSAN